jgi:hypothetical protein
MTVTEMRMCRTMMTNTQRALAVLNYGPYDRMPIVHFGFWLETLEKWRAEGHLTLEESTGFDDGNIVDRLISAKLGFDFNWLTCFTPDTGLHPVFEERVIDQQPDGMRKFLNVDGVVVLQKDGVRTIPAEVDHLLKGRTSWEEHYLPKLQYSDDRIDFTALERLRLDANRSTPVGLHCGSLLGKIREYCGIVGFSYLLADDEALVDEMIETVGNLCYEVTSKVLSSGVRFDFGHFWEDICFKSGPLVNPAMFATKVGPHYKRIVDLLHDYGIQIVSLDCDGKIDRLVPIWLENGVNTMFPIEVGTWNASIRPWRELYGKSIKGVGGMNKNIFSRDRAAVQAEIERLRPLVTLGGYIPCPDHRIAPDAKWDNVQYYCEQMRAVYGA